MKTTYFFLNKNVCNTLKVLQVLAIICYDGIQKSLSIVLVIYISNFISLPGFWKIAVYRLRCLFAPRSQSRFHDLAKFDDMMKDRMNFWCYINPKSFITYPEFNDFFLVIRREGFTIARSYNFIESCESFNKALKSRWA